MNRRQLFKSVLGVLVAPFAVKVAQPPSDTVKIQLHLDGRKVAEAIRELDRYAYASDLETGVRIRYPRLFSAGVQREGFPFK